MIWVSFRHGSRHPGRGRVGAQPADLRFLRQPLPAIVPTFTFTGRDYDDASGLYNYRDFERTNESRPFMTRSFQCPHCSRMVELAEETQGTQVLCPACAAALEVDDRSEPQTSISAGEPMPSTAASTGITAMTPKPDQSPREEGRDVNLRKPALNLAACVIFAIVGLSIIAVGTGYYFHYLSTPPVANVPREPHIISLETNDIIYDPTRKLIYAAVSGTDVKHANTIAAIDPVTRKIEWTINVGGIPAAPNEDNKAAIKVKPGSDPGVLALSPDAKSLWIGFLGENTIHKIDIETRTAEFAFKLDFRELNGAAFALNEELVQAEAIVPLPDSPDTVVVALRTKWGSTKRLGVAVYDKGVRRPNKTDGQMGSHRLVRSLEPGILYGFNNEASEGGLRRLRVDEKGVTEIRSWVAECGGEDILYNDGLIYSSRAEIVDPVARRRIGKIPVENVAFRGVDSFTGYVAINAESNTIYTFRTRDSLQIEVFDKVKLTKYLSIPLQYPKAAGNVRGNLIHVGGDTLAFRFENAMMIVELKVER